MPQAGFAWLANTCGRIVLPPGGPKSWVSLTIFDACTAYNVKVILFSGCPHLLNRHHAKIVLAT